MSIVISQLGFKIPLESSLNGQYFGTKTNILRKSVDKL